jgi:uncharacterized protein
MRTVFADTGYWQAVTSPRDALHAKALDVSNSLGRVRIVTTEMVLAELLAALAGVPTRKLAAEMARRITTDPNVEVVPQTGLQFREAFQLYCDRLDHSWSLTDCASFRVMRARSINEALAHDQHFVQAGFQALLRDD